MRRTETSHLPASHGIRMTLQYEVGTKQTISHIQQVEVKDFHPRSDPTDHMLSGNIFHQGLYIILQELPF